MHLKRLTFVLLTLYMISFPTITFAVDSFILMRMHYLNLDEEGKLYWESGSFLVQSNLSDEEKASALFIEFFEGGQVIFMPDDVKLLSACLRDGHLSINVSKEILDYGGSYYERCLKNQIIKTALDIPGVDEVTLLVDDRLQYLPEGSMIFNETVWSDIDGE